MSGTKQFRFWGVMYIIRIASFYKVGGIQNGVFRIWRRGKGL